MSAASSAQSDLEPWMRGIIPGIDPVIGHLLRAAEQIREDAAKTLAPLTPHSLWCSEYGVTSAGFHARHLAGSTRRLCAYLEGRQLTAEELAALALEQNAGHESATELLTAILDALAHYETILGKLSPSQFSEIREIGRKRYQTTAVSLAIHIAEHAQRHIGGMIAASKLVLQSV